MSKLSDTFPKCDIPQPFDLISVAPLYEPVLTRNFGGGLFTFLAGYLQRGAFQHIELNKTGLGAFIKSFLFVTVAKGSRTNPYSRRLILRLSK